MVTDTRIEYRPNPLRQGSRNRRGDQVDREFVGQLLHLLGDVRAIWLPGKSGATLTDRSRYVRVLTWSEDVSAFDTKPVELGSGYAVHFNGTDEEGDAPDADELSFGDGAVDQPFSVIALVRPDTNSNTEAILAKDELTTGSTQREWFFLLNGGRPEFSLRDDSASASIGRRDATTVTAATWTLLVGTYDGSRAEPGIRLYKDANRVDDTSIGSGAYTAMENKTSKLDSLVKSLCRSN